METDYLFDLERRTRIGDQKVFVLLNGFGIETAYLDVHSILAAGQSYETV